MPGVELTTLLLKGQRQQEYVYTVRKTETKEAEIDSGVAPCEHKVSNGPIPFSKGGNYLLSPYNPKENRIVENIPIILNND